MKKSLIAIGLVLLSILSTFGSVFADRDSTPFEKVNSLPYSYGAAKPALDAFRLVATDRGWTPNKIKAWTPFVDDVIRKESGYCWNVRNEERAGVGCRKTKRSNREAAGFGQLTAVHYHGWLCKQEGLCSAVDVIRTPWNSMTALVALIERSGKGPWCYRAARGFHACRLAP